MNASDLLTHPLAQRLTWTLIHFVWQGTLIAILLAAIVEARRVRTPQARYAYSLAALLAMILVIPLTWLAMVVPQAAVSTAHEVSLVNFAGAAAQSLPAAAAASPAPELTLIERATSLLQQLQPALFLVWLVGFLALNTWLIVGWLATQRMLHSRERLPSELVARLSRLGYRFQVSVQQVVFVSSRVTEAVAIGFLKPVVLVPAAWLVELPPQLLEAVIAHELAHVRRCDVWVNLLQRLVESVLFYHPAVWWLSARLRRERELCCDELAVAATGQRLEYVEALEFTARLALVDGRPALAAGFLGESKMNLLHRVRSVLGISTERPASLWPASLLLGGLSLALLAATYSASNTSANAQEDKPKEGERREGEIRREGDKPREGEVRRDVDRPREGEVRRDGDRPREGEVRRDGDRPRPEGEVRRDGDRPRPEGAPRDGERRPDVRPGAGEQAEMMQIIRQLRAEVAELRQEVARLRGERPGADRPREGERLGLDRPREGGDRPRPDARPDAPRREGDRPAADRPREGGDRPRPDVERREGGDRPRPDAERAREGGDRPRPDAERREGGDRPKAEGERR